MALVFKPDLHSNSLHDKNSSHSRRYSAAHSPSVPLTVKPLCLPPAALALLETVDFTVGANMRSATSDYSAAGAVAHVETGVAPKKAAWQKPSNEVCAVMGVCWPALSDSARRASSKATLASSSSTNISEEPNTVDSNHNIMETGESGNSVVHGGDQAREDTTGTNLHRGGGVEMRGRSNGGSRHGHPRDNFEHLRIAYRLRGSAHNRPFAPRPPPPPMIMSPFANQFYNDMSNVYYVPMDLPRPVPVPMPMPMVQYSSIFVPPSEPRLSTKIMNQINYYFSTENLVKDVYLRKHMDSEGWVSVMLIAKFNRIAQMTNNIQVILDAMKASNVVEVQGDKMRRKNNWKEWLLPVSFQP